MQKISFEIETLAPVVISSASNSTVMTSTHSEIGGSIIRGVLAKKYISAKKLKTPYLDEDFKNIFYGKLNFLSATPKILNQRSFVLPLSLQSGKKGTDGENKILDLMTVEKAPPGYKNFRGYGIVDDEKIFTAEVKKNISLHMSRNLENGRLSGKSEGHIYNYESLDARQIFCGEIIGEEIELKKLVETLNLKNNSAEIFVGKSRFTQYGKCKISFGDIEEINFPSAANEIFLRLESPLISAEDYFIDAEKILQSEVADELNKIFGEKIFTLGKVFASAVEVENFVTHWSMKRPRVLALAAGTIFELKVEKNLSADEFKILAEKNFAGFGVRTEEGFGQARFWQAKNFTREKLEEFKPEKPKKFSDKTLEIAKKILLSRCLEQVRICAYEDAEKLKLRDENLTHFFSRLDGILSSFGNSTDIQKNFQHQLESEIRDGSLFETNLKNLRMANGQSFFDVLTGRTDDFPYPIEKLKSDLNFKNLLDDLEINLDFVEEKIFVEYLQNYFRFARKLSAKGGDENE